MSTRIITDELLINGMPCHKYILRGLGTTVDAITFRKTYVNTMIAAGATYDEIEASLPLLSIKLDRNSPIVGYNFCSYNGTTKGLSLIDSIRLDENVATYRTCDKFYKKYDNKAIGCRLCPLSAKYLNRNIQIERAVMSYALSSRSALQNLLDNHISAEHFTSVIDIMGFFSYTQKPSCYPLFSQTFSALQIPEIQADYYSSKENGKPSVELIAYHDANLTSSYIPKGVLSPELIMRLEEVLSDELEKRECPSESEIDLLILQLTNPEIDVLKNNQAEPFSFVNLSSEGQATLEKTSRSTPIAMQSNMGLNKLDTFYDIPPVKKKRKATTKKSRLERSSPPPFHSLPNVEALPQTLEETEKNIFSDYQQSSDAMSCNYERIKNAEVVDKLPGKCSTYYGVPDDQISFAEISQAANDIPLFIREGTRDSMIVLPIIPEKELSHFAICLDTENARLLSIFESHVLKEKKLGIELILTEEKTAYILMFSPRMRAYFFTDLVSPMVKEILLPILEYSSITKYCYFPYPIISALWKIGIYIKGMYSLFSMSALLYGNHHMCMEDTLKKMGAFKAVSGVTIKPSGTIRSIPLNFMHAYVNVFNRCRHECVKRGIIAEYEKRNHFDRVIGYSYYQNHLMESGTTLFTLSTANGYCFQSCLIKPLKGYLLLRCTLKNFIMFSAPVIRDLLIKLEEMGRFRKRKLWLAGVSSNSFTLCIEEGNQKNTSSILNTTILAYLHENDLAGMEYDLELL